MWKTKFGRCIYQSPSGYKVYQNCFYRWLTLGSPALQTMISRRTPQKPILYYLPVLTLMARHYPGSACLLGLGGGGVPLMLSHNPAVPLLVAVDNSEEVIEIAKRFFNVDKLKNLHIIQENARDFLAQSKTQFSHLMVDLYDAHRFPSECNNELFFSHCKNNIADHGFLAVNLANWQEQWPLFQLVKKYFKHTLVIPVQKSANMVIIASNESSKELFLQQIEKTGELKRILWTESWEFVGEM